MTSIRFDLILIRMQTKFNHFEQRSEKVSSANKGKKTKATTELEWDKRSILKQLEIRHKLFWENIFKA